MRILGAMFILLCWGSSSVAAETRTTLFLDGARIDVAASISDGYLQLPLPPALVSGSLRVRPLGNITIDRVEIVPAPTDGKKGVKLDKLTQRKEQLEDRLKALETREEIFTAAAKSQSGKAPRKSKNNPEPVAAIRQGTNFALSQLEEVYQARRKAEKELTLIRSRLDTLGKGDNKYSATAKIWTRGKAGKVHISYLISDLNWKPSYDFRIEREGELVVTQKAVYPTNSKISAVDVIPALTTDVSASPRLHVGAGAQSIVGSWQFPLENLLHKKTAQETVSYHFTNTSKVFIPAGDAACFYKGEYFGRFRFNGLGPGEKMNVACGI